MGGNPICAQLSGIKYNTYAILGFLLAGIGGIAISMLVENVVISSLSGVFAFSSLWTIKELFEQQKRVAKGWFPKKDKKRNQKAL